MLADVGKCTQAAACLPEVVVGVGPDIAARLWVGGLRGGAPSYQIVEGSVVSAGTIAVYKTHRTNSSEAFVHVHMAVDKQHGKHVGSKVYLMLRNKQQGSSPAAEDDTDACGCRQGSS